MATGGPTHSRRPDHASHRRPAPGPRQRASHQRRGYGVPRHPGGPPQWSCHDRHQRFRRRPGVGRSGRLGCFGAYRAAARSGGALRRVRPGGHAHPGRGARIARGRPAGRPRRRLGRAHGVRRARARGGQPDAAYRRRRLGGARGPAGPRGSAGAATPSGGSSARSARLATTAAWRWARPVPARSWSSRPSSTLPCLANRSRGRGRVRDLGGECATAPPAGSDGGSAAIFPPGSRFAVLAVEPPTTEHGLPRVLLRDQAGDRPGRMGRAGRVSRWLGSGLLLCPL
jgi:hypothetical protein